MGLTANIMMGGLSLANGVQQSMATKQQSEFTAGQYESNATFANLQATDAISRADQTASKLKREGKQAVGAQRAALAAQGVDVGTGSALDVTADTAAQVAADVDTAKLNGWKEAWGYKVQAQDYTAKAGFERIAGENKSRSTLLTGALTAGQYGWLGIKDFGK